MWIRRLSELALLASLLTPAAAARAEPADSMTADRERFRHGMDRYRERAFDEAIADWEPIYADLGPERGYRLAYDLGVAYAEIGDTVRAVERLQAFVSEVDARRGRGETLEAIVAKEDADAQARLATLTPKLPARAPEAAPAPAPEPVQGPGPASASASAPEPAPAAAPAPVAHHSLALPVLSAVSGGLAVASAVAAVPLYAHAQSLRDQYVAAQMQSSSHSISGSDRQAFSTARTLAYATISGAAGLGALSATCAALYLFGPSRAEGAVTAGVGPEHGGASVQLSAWF
jgi:hypothetical protein